MRAAQKKAPSAWPIAAALCLVTVLLFWRATGHDFVNYDDPDYVTSNEQVQRGLTLRGIAWALTAGEASNWHPLTWMSHMLDWSLFDERPRGHHATSVLLHGLNAALAFLALRRLTGAFWASALCAALFAWHPLRVESVAWVAERKDVLSGFFFFATLWAYAAYVARRATPSKAAGRCYALALATFALGLMAKPMLVTLPCVLLLLDVWPLRRLTLLGIAGENLSAPDRFGRVVLEKLPFFALAVASSVATYFVQKSGGAVASALPLDARLGNAVVATVGYVGKFLWPAELAVLYPHPGYWPRATVALCALVLVGSTAVAWLARRRFPWVLIGWLWFVGMLVPVIGLVQVGLQSMADRYTYLPILGLQIAGVWTVRAMTVSPAARLAGQAIAFAVLVACAIRTSTQLGVWRNSFTLFDHTLKVTKDNYVAHDNRGFHLMKQGRVDEAMADYRRALAIKPGYLQANNNLGHALAQQGRPAEAIPYYRAALAAKPDHVEVRNNLANALSDLNQLDEAMEHYDFVLARHPQHVNALNGSGVVLAMRGKPAEARARIEQALRLAPDNAAAHNNLGNVCSMLGQLQDAATHYAAAARLQPEAHTHAQLAATLAQLGRRDEALRAVRTALQLRPDHPQARALLAQLTAGGAK